MAPANQPSVRDVVLRSLVPSAPIHISRYAEVLGPVLLIGQSDEFQDYLALSDASADVKHPFGAPADLRVIFPIQVKRAMPSALIVLVVARHAPRRCPNPRILGTGRYLGRCRHVHDAVVLGFILIDPEARIAH